MPTIPELSVKLKERLGPSRFWTAQERTDACLEAVRIWQCYTGFLTKEVVALSSGSYAGVPRQIAWPIRVKLGTTDLDRQSLWELDEGSVGWEGAASGTPTSWASHGMSQVALTPAYASAGEVRYSGPENILRGHAAGVEIPLSDGDIQAVLDYAQHYCSFKEGSGELEDTQDLLKSFAGRAGAQNARLRRQNFYRAAMMEDRGETQPGAQRGAAGVDFVRGGTK